MPISEQNVSKLNLLTASEVAATLKMNQQVVLRKLNAGDIQGYKLGKEWRVSEEQLIQYLDLHSNSLDRDDSKILRTFFKSGKLVQIPASRGKRQTILKFLVDKLDHDRVYLEKEINDFLGQYHSDVCMLRREFIMNKLMVRKDGKYKRVSF